MTPFAESSNASHCSIFSIRQKMMPYICTYFVMTRLEDERLLRLLNQVMQAVVRFSLSVDE